MSTFRRKRFGRHQRKIPQFNPLTMNIEFAKGLGEVDEQQPIRTVEAPSHKGQGVQWQPRNEEKQRPRDIPPGPMH